MRVTAYLPVTENSPTLVRNALAFVRESFGHWRRGIYRLEALARKGASVAVLDDLSRPALVVPMLLPYIAQ